MGTADPRASRERLALREGRVTVEGLKREARARARLLLDEGADLFGAALTQVPHTGTHQAKIAAA